MEQTTMSEAELTLLSLLSESARYGHELQQIIDERGLREWVAIGFSSLYYLLNKLERQGLISSDQRPDTTGVPRKRYFLTDAGKGVLQTAVSDLLRQPHALGSGFELGLANLSVLKPLQVYVTMMHHQADLRQRLEAVEKSWERHQQDEDTPSDEIRALYTHSIAVMRAELNWLTEFIADWAQRYPAVERPVSQASKPATAEVPANQKVTLISRRPMPDPAKQIQRLRRPRKPE